MHNLPNKTGSISNGETSWEDGDSRTPSEGKSYLKKLINSANSVSLLKIFNHYGLNINEYNKKIVCPFSNHQNGRERTPSFYYYFKTNTYHCFGCKQGSTPVDFVSYIENISKEKSALKIIEIFNSDVDENSIFNRESFDERLDIMMKFSNFIRNFKRENLSEQSDNFIENTCKIYDTLNAKLSLSNEALREFVETLLIQGISKYKSSRS